MTKLASFTEAHRRAYDAHFTRAASGQDRRYGARRGEALWHYKPGEWTPDELFDLEGAGLLIRVRREWKDNFVSFPDPEEGP